MAFIDQAPDYPLPAASASRQYVHIPPWGIEPLEVQQPELAGLGQTPQLGAVEVLLTIAALGALGYAVYRVSRSDEDDELEDEVDTRFVVELYDASDRRRGSWAPRRRIPFERRSDAEDYREQQQAYFDRIVIVEEAA